MAKSSLFFMASLLVFVVVLPLLPPATAWAGEATISLGEAKTTLEREDEKLCYKPIENIKDQHFQSLGLLAVTEYNQQHGRNLKFQEVFDGSYFVHLGTSYDLRIRATDRIDGTYLAIVYKAGFAQNVKYIFNELVPISRNQAPLQMPASLE